MNLSSKDRKNLEEIYESMTSGDVFGGTEFDIGIDNKDWYAPGDARNPYGLGSITLKGKLKTKKGKKRKKKRPSSDRLFKNF